MAKWVGLAITLLYSSNLAKLTADFKITVIGIVNHNLLTSCSIHKPMFVCESLACANLVFMLFPCSGFSVGKSGYFFF